MWSHLEPFDIHFYAARPLGGLYHLGLPIGRGDLIFRNGVPSMR